MDLRSNSSAHINSHCRRGMAPKPNPHEADKPGCRRPLHLGVCCLFTGHPETILSL
jgi:hypothetical protein